MSEHSCTLYDRPYSRKENIFFDDRDDYNKVYSIKEMLVCPQCTAPIAIENSFKLHITKELKSCLCQKCDGIITYESLLVKAFLKNSKTLLSQLAASSETNVVDFKSLLLWFRDSLNSYIIKNKSTLQQTYKRDAFKAHFKEVRAKFADKIKYVRNNLSFLPMDLVQGLFIQLEFVNKICSNYEHWTNASTIDTAIARYGRFFNLLTTHPGKLLVPTMDIDLAWHAHQVAPDSLYRYHCELTTGKIIDHDDTLGKSPLAIGYARTFILWNQTYNEYYSHKAPEYKDFFFLIRHKIDPFRWYKWNKYGKIKTGRTNVITGRNNGNTGRIVAASTCAGGCSPISMTNEGDEGSGRRSSLGSGLSSSLGVIGVEVLKTLGMCGII